MCRCPSTYFCRRQHLGKIERESGELCGRDGKTYRSRCLLQVAECATNKKIRVAHKGRCLADSNVRKQKGHRKYHSKVKQGGADEAEAQNNQKEEQVIKGPITHNENPVNNRKEMTNQRKNERKHGNDRRVPNVNDNGKINRRQKYQKSKENRRQRRKERINRRIKRRYGGSPF